MSIVFEELLEKRISRTLREKQISETLRENMKITSMLKRYAKNEIYLNGSFFYSTSIDKASLQEIIDNFEKYYRIDKNRWVIMPFGVNVTGKKKWEKKGGFSLWFK